MSLVKKIKDILFEEEEDYTEPVKITREKKEEPVRFAPPKEDTSALKDEGEPVQIFAKPYDEEAEKKEVKKEEVVTPSERDLFKTDNSFKFPDFDEEEFDTSMANMAKSRPNTNVLDYERKKTTEKRNDYNRYEREIRETKDYKEVTEKKKFKPSPIISPVYGILNQDYKAEDIVNRSDTTIDIEEVRKKAFEMPREEKVVVSEVAKKIEIEEKPVEKKKEEKEEVLEPIDEPVVTFFEEKDSEVNNKDDYKTIDDLLESASEEIPLEDTLELPKTNNLDAIEEELEKIETPKKEEKTAENLDDTLDSDLFELIDSMYEEREEG